MSKKIGAQRKRAFLIYLGQTGNQTLAAERAKVSRDWVRRRRSCDAEFDARCRSAIETAKARLAGSSPVPNARGTGDRWQYYAGHELMVRGTGGSGGGKWVQIARAREKQWTPRVEKRFLTVLAATCNVKAACAEVGMWPPSAYSHRRRWQAFAKAWDEAIETAYFRLESALVHAACNFLEPPEVELDLRIRDMTTADAMQLMHMHRHKVHGLGKPPGTAPRVATDEEVRRALARSLRAHGVRVTKEDMEGDGDE